MITIIGAAIALAAAAAILPGQYATRSDIADLRKDMARLEGFTRREPGSPPTA